MKKIVLPILVLMSTIFLFSACSSNKPVMQDTKEAETVLTNAEKIIGVWDIIGESEDTDSGEQLYEYYTSPKGTWTFYENGTFSVALAGVSKHTYTVEHNTFIKVYDEKSGEYEGYDLKISWQGEDLVLAEYWRENHNEFALYDQEDDHDFYILRRKK